jgi:hypothetical protein
MATTILSQPVRANAGLLAAVLEHVASQAGISHEQREAPRYQVQAPVTLGVFLTAEDSYRPLYRAWALEISRDGLGLLLEHDLPVDVRLHANLESLAERRCILPVRVVYSRRLLPATCRVGAAFIDPA